MQDQSGFRRPSTATRVVAYMAVGSLTLACGLGELGDLAPAEATWNFAHYGPCLVDDVTGDGVGEVAVLVYQEFEVQYAALLDGATGEQVWRGEAYAGAETAAFCVGPSHFAVVPPGVSRLDVYPVAAHESVQQLTLSNRAFRVGRGPGCFTVEATSREAVGFSLGDADHQYVVERAPCSAEDLLTAIAHTNTGEPDWSDGEPVSTSHGSATYEMSFREEGTELIRIGRVGGWSRELPLLVVDTGNRAGVVAVPDGVVVIGEPHPPPEDDTAQVVGLAAADGTTRFETSIVDRYTVGLAGVIYNERYVVAGIGNTVRAFDPSTGEIVWMLGHVNPVGRQYPRR